MKPLLFLLVCGCVLAASPNPTPKITQAVQQHAQAYFKTKYRPGSASVRVVSVSVKIESVGEASGWPDRYDVSGTAKLRLAGGGVPEQTLSISAVVKVERSGGVSIVSFSYL